MLSAKDLSHKLGQHVEKVRLGKVMFRVCGIGHGVCFIFHCVNLDYRAGQELGH